MKMTIIDNKSIGLFDKNRYSEAQREIYKQRQISKDKAEIFFTKLFNQHIAWVIIANVCTKYRNSFKKGALSFEEAWQSLDYQTVMDIVFRAINDLPCSSKDNGELQEFLNKQQSEVAQ